MSKPILLAAMLALCFCGCSRKPPGDTAVMIIESSPANLDPRIGTDAQSERIDKLLFDSLVVRDQHLDLQPSLAERWETPDPLTYVFHLRSGVYFHNGEPLTARDVKWTFDSILNGTVVTSKASIYSGISSISAPDDHTVVFHLKEPNSTLLWNLSDGAIGIVPFGSGADVGQRPVGSGPFRFVSAVQDGEVVLERNTRYWDQAPKIGRVKFVVVPDTTTRALELRKGSADVEINAISADMVFALRKEPALEVEVAPGTIYNYLAFNLRDPILKDVRVRQAIAYAIDRQVMIKYLWRDLAEPAQSVLPRQSWAYNGDVPDYAHDPAKARALLDQAGYPARNGVRFHLTMKTSTEETTRLMAAVMQQQLAEVGIQLDIRTFEFATFYSDVVKGAFQMYSLRWIGGNQDPDIFEHIFSSHSFPPKRANRSYYVNPRVDELIEQGKATLDQQQRKQIYDELQRILAHDLPYVNLWYLDNVVIHSRRLRNIRIDPTGSYDFLKTAELAPVP